METIKSYRVRRRLKFGEEYRFDGLAPEMHLYRYVDAHVHSGALTYEDVDLDEFRAAVDAQCPELKDRLYELLGINDKPKPVKKSAPKVEKLKD